MLNNWLIKLILLLVLAAPNAAVAVTPQVPAAPPERVVDLADIIAVDQEQELISVLRELEEKTTIQMVILTINSLDGEDIDSFSLKIAEQWKPGQKDKDNGLLLTVALQDKKYRFETGYGLESVLPDSLLGSIGREFLVPYFKKGNYGQGIAAATGQIIHILSEQYQVAVSGSDQLPGPLVQDVSHAPALVIFFLMVIFFIIVVNSMRKNKKSPGAGPILYSGSSWSSGGGFGGGSFGGGFGGGGGGFGGGGASGGW